MSIQAVAWVLGDRKKNLPAHPSTGSARLVMVSLANHANDAWEAWPAVESIAWEAGLSVRRTHDALRKCEAEGWITREFNAAPDERIPVDKRPNLYRLVGGVDTSSIPADERGGHFGTSGVDTSSDAGWTDRPPKPSVEPSLNLSLSLDKRVQEAFDLLVERDVKKGSAFSDLISARAYRATCKKTREEDGTLGLLNDLAGDNPDWPVEALADAIEFDEDEETVRNRLRCDPPPCGYCNSTRWSESVNGDGVVRCPVCWPVITGEEREAS